MSEAYIAHHGIRGQKWGVRRFQNEDGSLTDAGRERYLKGMNSREKVEYLKSDEGTRHAVEKYMDQGLTYTEANEQVVRDNRERNKKIAIAGAAAIGTILAVYGGYKLYKHLGNEVDKAKEWEKQLGNNYADAMEKSILTKDWDTADVEKMRDLATKQAAERAANIDRKSIVRDKLGIQSKADKQQFWNQTYERQNLENAANRRGELNRRIANQREKIASLKGSRDYTLQRTSDDARRAALGKSYDADKMNSIYKEADASHRASAERQIEMGRQVLDELLKQKRALL